MCDTQSRFDLWAWESEGWERFLRQCTVATWLQKMSSIMVGSRFSDGLHRLMSQGTQRLNPEFLFFGVARFHQCVVGDEERCPAASSDSNAAMQSGNGGAQSGVTGGHLCAKSQQERGASKVSILEELLSHLNVPVPVPEEGATWCTQPGHVSGTLV